MPLHQTFQLKAPSPSPNPTRQAVIPAERWGADLKSPLRIWNASTSLHLPYIWRTVALLKKEKARVTMEAAYKRIAEILRFRPTSISHSVEVMVMALAFHTKDPDMWGTP